MRVGRRLTVKARGGSVAKHGVVVLTEAARADYHTHLRARCLLATFYYY